MTAQVIQMRDYQRREREQVAHERGVAAVAAALGEWIDAVRPIGDYGGYVVLPSDSEPGDLSG